MLEMLLTGSIPLPGGGFCPGHFSRSRGGTAVRVAARRQISSRIVCSAAAKTAVVVGAGPSGLASAIMLAKRGWGSVTVIDRQEDIGSYNPSLGFTYMIDGRGQRALRQIDENVIGGLQREAAAGSSTNTIRVFNTDGTVKTTTMNIDSHNYWIARHSFIHVLYKQMVQAYSAAVNIRSATKCTGVSQKGGELTVHTENESGEIEAINADLVVAADGINSSVRLALASKEPEKYGVVEAPSAAGGLLYKVLTLPGGFSMPGGFTFPPERDGTVQIHAVAGVFGGRESDLRLGLLPTPPGAEVCTANIIRVPEHNVWKMKTGEELLDLLGKAFPQINIREIIPAEEAERFVTAKAGVFPNPQYCSTLYKVIEPDSADSKAVVILGDAAHAFPPDLGQGVNSALQDVEALARALEVTGDNVGKAAAIYHDERLPQTAALIRLMQFGGPFQYKQSRLGDTCWRINIVVRLLLNKIAPKIFSKAAFLLITDKNLSYTDVLESANRTTRNIFISAFAAVVLIAAALIKFSTIG
mmetsp:Transcript_1417/g.4108  ORF Transcript_1417/g.4108 Transcript_1417/m.4108 type:complete len:528 (+) Transcript_1417:250-1833(+)